MSNRKAELRDWYSRVWENGETDLIDIRMAPKARINGLEEETLVGPEDFKRFQAMLLSMVRDVKVVLPVMLEDGDWISATILVDGVVKSTNTPFRTSGLVMLRYEQDQIVEAYNQLNLFPFFESAGLLPAHTVDHCLMGISPCLGLVAVPEDTIAAEHADAY